MATPTMEHFRHLAERAHKSDSALKKFKDKHSARLARYAGLAFSVAETGAGAWLGGTLEGRTDGRKVGPLPLNLGVGVVLLTIGQLELADKYSSHLLNVGNGFVGSYFAAVGYSFGKRWKESGKTFPPLWGGHSWGSPYGGEVAPPAVHGNLSQAQMDDIVNRMQAAAAAPAHG